MDPCLDLNAGDARRRHEHADEFVVLLFEPVFLPCVLPFFVSFLPSRGSVAARLCSRHQEEP